LVAEKVEEKRYFFAKYVLDSDLLRVFVPFFGSSCVFYLILNYFSCYLVAVKVEEKCFFVVVWA
jgi:hypothetical protein